MNGNPRCGAQTPDEPPGAFDWWVIAAILAAAGALAYIYSNGLPLINGLIALAKGSAVVLPSAMLAASAAGALAVLALVGYYLLQPDGCIVPKQQTQAVCGSGIVESTVDLTSTAVAVFAPFARGPAFAFDIVVKTIYWFLVTQNAQWVLCNPIGAAMLRCLIENKVSCAARIGAAIGAIAGAIPGIVLGFLAGAAIASLACGPFVLLCLLLALIVAAIIAAAITYAGAMVGGWIGAGIAELANDDAVGDTAKSLSPGAIVTVRGDWTRDADVGYNTLFYTTAIGRNGMFPTPPSYTTADADSTPADDCPIAPVIT
jgi:hypothetical protein